MARVSNSRRMGGGRETATCPFVIQVDTREQRPYMFSDLRTGKKSGEKLIVVPLEFATLRDGDYSIVGLTDRIAVERKSKEDLYGSVGRRANFVGRLERMHAMTLGGGYAAVVVECDHADLLSPPVHSRLCPRSLNRTIIAWRQRYRVDWWFLPSRVWAEAITFRLLERFYLDSLKAHHEARHGTDTPVLAGGDAPGDLP